MSDTERKTSDRWNTAAFYMLAAQQGFRLRSPKVRFENLIRAQREIESLERDTCGALREVHGVILAMLSAANMVLEQTYLEDALSYTKAMKEFWITLETIAEGGAEMLYSETSKEAVPRRLYPAVMWDGVVKLLAQAREADKRGDIMKRHETLLRAQAVVTAIDASYEDQRNPEAAPHIHIWHRQILNLMVRANTHREMEALAKAMEEASTLADMWRQAAAQAGAGKEGAV